MQRDRIVIGASAGGVSALSSLVGQLPADFAVPIFIVQHTLPGESYLPQILNQRGPLRAMHPADGETIQQGHIYVALPDLHMVFMDGCIRLVRGPRENYSRPSIDVLFRSAANVFGPRTIGMLLTGSNDDGAAGLMKIQQAGGATIVQDPDDAAHPDMPEAALRYMRPDYVTRIEEAGALLMRLAAGQAVPAEEPVDCAPPPVGEAGAHAVDDVFSCPECGGALKVTRNGDLVQFHCYVGHMFSPESMLNAEADMVERAVWAAVRALEDSAAVSEKLAAGAGMNSSMRGYYMDRAKRQREYAHTMRALLTKL